VERSKHESYLGHVEPRANVERRALEENLALAELLLGRHAIGSTEDQAGLKAEALLQLEIDSRSKQDERQMLLGRLAEVERRRLPHEQERRQVRDRACALGLKIVADRAGGYLVFPADEAHGVRGLPATGCYAYHWETVIELVERHATHAKTDEGAARASR
jgi:hypothetical protein